MRDFRKIRAWMLADDLAVAVYQATRGFPKEELYGLTNQIRRAVVSVAANIVEGSAREGSKEYLHFCMLRVARWLKRSIFCISQSDWGILRPLILMSWIN